MNGVCASIEPSKPSYFTHRRDDWKQLSSINETEARVVSCDVILVTSPFESFGSILGQFATSSALHQWSCLGLPYRAVGCILYRSVTPCRWSWDSLSWVSWGNFLTHHPRENGAVKRVSACRWGFHSRMLFLNQHEHENIREVFRYVICLHFQIRIFGACIYRTNKEALLTSYSLSLFCLQNVSAAAV